MDFKSNNIYHIYNRGNNRQNIFLTERNYIYFLGKVRKYISPTCNILAYVLMPNHFHFLIHADQRTEECITRASITKNVLSEGVRLLLSSYTKGINKQEDRTGNLIQQKTKSKCVYDVNIDDVQYAITCFHYIHQNPVRAGLVNKIEDWHFSSYRDFAGLRNGTLPNKSLSAEKFQLSVEDLSQKMAFSDESLKNIW